MRLVQQLTQHFSARWSTDYLLSLQPKAKWLKQTANINVGDIVICWKLGRIINTHAGEDGLVRVITIKTERQTIKRPIRKIHLLPKDC